MASNETEAWDKMFANTEETKIEKNLIISKAKSHVVSDIAIEDDAIMSIEATKEEKPAPK